LNATAIIQMLHEHENCSIYGPIVRISKEHFLTMENISTVFKHCLQASILALQLWQDFFVKHVSDVTKRNAAFISQNFFLKT